MITLNKQHRRYEKYRDSGTEWFWEIPQEWEIRRVKKILKSYTAGVWGEDPKGDGNDILCVRVADFDYGHLSVSDTTETLRSVGVSDRSRKQLHEGDILLEKSGGGEQQLVGRAVLFTIKNSAVCSNFIERLELQKEMDSKFTAYLLKAMYMGRLTTRSIKQTTGIQNLDLSSFFNERCPFPKICIQSSITSYLDEKCALIDTLIAKKQRQIELLQEQRAAIIHKAVMRGLDESAGLKETGIRWVGKVPKIWKHMPLKRIVSIKITDGPHTTPEFVENGVPFISVESVKEGGKIDFESKRGDISKELDKEYSKKCKPKRDDIFIVKSGSTTGKIGMVDTDLDFNIWSPLALVRLDKKKALPLFMFYLMQSEYFHRQIELSWSFGTQPNIGMGQIEKLIVLLPASIEEQLAIVHYLQSELRKIETVINSINQSINFLNEYKTSLISHAVTGKVKVA